MAGVRFDQGEHYIMTNLQTWFRDQEREEKQAEIDERRAYVDGLRLDLESARRVLKDIEYMKVRVR
jgi:capsule polysaccharide modification protein KpsS